MLGGRQLALRRKLVVFAAQDAFPGHHVGPGPVDAVGLVGPVEIDHQAALGGLLDHFPVPAHHFLVLPVHEVDLDTGDAPVAVQRESVVEGVIPGGIVGMDPEPAADVPVLGVGEDFRHVQLRRGLRDVRIRLCVRAVPLPVDEHVGPAHLRGEVDVFLDGGHVHLDLAAPPVVPGAHAGLDPGRVLDGAGLVQGMNGFRFDEPAGVVGNHHQAPGGTDDIIEPDLDAFFVFLEVPPGLLFLPRDGGEVRFQGAGPAGGFADAQVEAGPVVHGSLRDGHIEVVIRFQQQGEAGNLAVRNGSQRRLGAPGLLGGAERTRVFRHPALRARRDGELGELPLDHPVAHAGDGI